MTKIFTYTEARQNLSSLLEQAQKTGKVIIKRKDGSMFVIQPVSKKSSPLDVKGVDIGLTADEIVSVIREIRERG